jgi:hypothetical protein
LVDDHDGHIHVLLARISNGTINNGFRFTKRNKRWRWRRAFFLTVGR